jgi:probable F420-dependent oxidoreductase
MRVGIDIPYFSASTDVRDYVQAVEALGFDYVGFAEHICATADSPFPSPMFTVDEPWRESISLAAFVAGATTRLEINPAMMLLALYHPVVAAKQLAEVANLSGGRLRVAASIGWNTRECESCGVEPNSRGARLEEQIGLIRRLWTEPLVDHVGRFFTLSCTSINERPTAVPPIWLGAGKMDEGGFPSPLAVERAARLADGFKFAAPSSFDPDRVERLADDLRAAVASAGRDLSSFGIEVRMVVQATEPDQWVSVIERAKRMGATHLGVANRIAGGSTADQIAWCQRFVDTTRGHW